MHDESLYAMSEIKGMNHEERDLKKEETRTYKSIQRKTAAVSRQGRL